MKHPTKSLLRLSLTVIPALFSLVSCQLNSGVKQTPLIGQIAVGANNLVGESDKNETGSLFAPRNYRNLQYRTLDVKSDGNGVAIPSRLTNFEEALGSYGAASDDDKAQFIRHCAGKIDINYYEWLQDYITGRASLSTGLDIFSKALSTAGAIFTPASTVRALSGSSAFVQGANSSIETNFFLSLTVIKQVPAMDAARSKTHEQLETLIGSGNFNIYRAAGLLDRYYMAGTQFASFGQATVAAAPVAKKDG